MSRADHFLRLVEEEEDDYECVCNCGQTFGHSIGLGFKHQREVANEHVQH